MDKRALSRIAAVTIGPVFAAIARGTGFMPAINLATAPNQPRPPRKKGRKTFSLHWRDTSRYTGAVLREIRKNGQAHECERRRLRGDYFLKWNTR